MRVPSKDHPLLISESSWNTRQNREKQVELAFEKFKAPAFFAAKNATLACFGVGRGTGLVINSGHQYTSIVPVHEGHCLLEPRVRTKIAGDYLTRLLEYNLRSTQIHVTPHCLIQKSAGLNEMDMEVEGANTDGMTESFLMYGKLRVLEDMKRHCYCVTKDPYSDS